MPRTTVPLPAAIRLSRWDADTRSALAVALRLACAPPLKRHRFAFEARVPWAAVEDLRAALDRIGLDWRSMK